MATKTEGGVEFPEGDYCYVGDPNVVSTWKLRVTSEPGGPPDPAIVGAAAAALSPGGYRGQPVDIPSADRPAAVACVRRAWTKANPDRADTEMPVGIRSEDDEPVTTTEIRSLDLDGPVEVRDLAKREIDMRLVPWNMPIETVQGREMFVSGAIDGNKAENVYLFGSEHEAHFGMGQDGKPTMKRRPTGKAIRLWNENDGPYATFKVARTAAGDEQLALAADGIVAGASIEFGELPQRDHRRDGQRSPHSRSPPCSARRSHHHLPPGLRAGRRRCGSLGREGGHLNG